MSHKLEIRITCRVAFKQIWHNISNVYLRTLHPGVQSDSSDDWHKLKSVAVGGPKEFAKLCLNFKNTSFSESLISFLVKLLLDYSTWIINFHILEFNLKQDLKQLEALGKEHF